MEIIPAIDIIAGQCIRLTRGNFSTAKVYSEDPLETAKMFESAGFRRLHLVDLEGAQQGSPQNLAVLEGIARATELVIDWGGGLKSIASAESVFNAGASMINGGSIVVKDPACFLSWLSRWGSEKIILSADVRGQNLAVSGWEEDTDSNIFTVLGQWVEKGIRKVVSTDISRDGMLSGPALELYTRILKQFPQLDLIASGGISSLEDIKALKGAGIHKAIVGKAFYEGKIDLAEAVLFQSTP